MLVDWINCHLVFFFESINWCEKEKKQENPSECFTHGLRKTIRVFNQVLSKMLWTKKTEILFNYFVIIYLFHMSD